MSALLHTRGLRAGYGRVEVLRGVDLEVSEDEVVVLLGANGAGKTTLLRALSGLLPARGEATFEGRSLAGRSADRIARLGIAHVPQGRGTFVDLTVEENLRVGGYARRDAAGVRADIERWLEFFPRLAERRDQLAGSMSGGEQQMLAIARALMSRPRLLLLDEPSLGLAPVVTKDLFAALAELNTGGIAMLIVEQAAHLALGIAARAYTLTAGELSGSLGVDELADRESLRRVYLGS